MSFDFEKWAGHNRRWLLLGIFCLSLLVRFLTAEYMENGGDCAGLWVNIRRVAEGMSFLSWDHHTMRWAINLPLLGLTKAFGSHPALYYVTPFAYASAGAVLFYLIGEKLHGAHLGIWGAMLFILYPQMAQTGSQIWPAVFEMTYIAACVFWLLVWLERKSIHWLVLAGIAFVLAWASRVTAIYFLPGLVCLIWLPTRDYKAVFIFGAAIGSLCFAELLYFWADTGNLLGRVGIIKSTHGVRDELLATPLEYLLKFKDFLKLRGLVGVLLACVIACWFAWKSRDWRVRALVVLFLSHVFLEAYMLSGFLPLKVAQPVGSRYHAVVAPFGIVILLFVLERIKPARAGVCNALLVLLVAAFTFFSAKKIPAPLSVLQMNRDAQVLPQALAVGDGLVVRYAPWEPNWIEARLMETFGYSGRRKDVDSSDLLRFMTKNRSRMYALFADDMRRSLDEVLPAMEQTGRYEYLVRTHGAESGPPSVGVEFGRKGFRTFMLKQSPEERGAS